jgi:hypothetical protein
MQLPEHYETDLLFFFQHSPAAMALYQALLRRMEPLFPQTALRVQKTQISFYDRHLFAAVSLPRSARQFGPEAVLVLTLGLNRRLDEPRAAVIVEPYPGRFTHHIPLRGEADLDAALLGWLQEARDFARSK